MSIRVDVPCAMKSCALAAWLATLPWAAHAHGSAPPPRLQCDAASIQLLLGSSATVTSAALLATPTAALPYCQVQGHVTTSGPAPTTNRVRWTVSMPATFANRYYFQGLGGSAGYLPPAPEKLLSAGFAFAGTDAGSPTPGVDWTFAFDRTKAFDYAQRGGHVSAVVTQKIVRAYYGLQAGERGRGQRLYRYHDGCSGGGRMGTVAAALFPGDYDGVIAGAPGINVANPLFFGQMAQHVMAHPDAWVSPQQLKQLEDAIVQRFDAADGVADGLVSDPSQVRLDDALLAPFTPAQRGTLRMLVAGLDAFGVRYAGLSLANPIGWSSFILGTTAPPWSLNPADNRLPPAGYLVFDTYSRSLYGPTYDFTTQFSFERAADVRGWNDTFEQVYVGSGTLQAPDLRRFFRQGGKMLFWHGTADNAISVFDMLRFYRDLTRDQGGLERTRDSARLFLAPGVLHCGGGIGPQDLPDQALQAIVRWVEKDQPPRTLVGHDVPAPGNAPRSFLMCAHPEVPRYVGAATGGSVNDAAQWRCVAPQGHGDGHGHGHGRDHDDRDRDHDRHHDRDDHRDRGPRRG